MVEPTEDAAARALANVIAAVDQAAQVMIGGPTPDQQRIAVVLADLDHLRPEPDRSHFEDCWQDHAGCLAARIRYTLTQVDT